MEEHTLRYGGYIFVVYFWILAAALVSGVLIMLTHTSQVLNNIYYTSKSLSLLLYTQASLSKPARIIQKTSLVFLVLDFVHLRFFFWEKEKITTFA